MEQLLIRIDNAKQLDIKNTKQAAEHFFILLKGTRNLQLLVGYQPETALTDIHQHVEDVVDLFIKAYKPLPPETQ